MVSPPFEAGMQGRAALPSKSRAMMLSIFSLSDSAIGPGFRARPGLHTEHLSSGMTFDSPGFHSRGTQHSIAFAISDNVPAMAARTTAHSTPFYPLPEYASSFLLDSAR